MKLLVIQNSAFQDIYSIGHSAFAYKLDVDIPIIEDEINNSGLIPENHYFFAALAELEKAEYDFDGIIISHWLYPGKTAENQDPSEKYNSIFSAVQLASYIRLSKIKNLRNSPILIVGPDPTEFTKIKYTLAEYILIESKHRPDILFANYGTTLKVISEIDWELEDETIEKDTFEDFEFKLSLASIFANPTRLDIELSYSNRIEPKLIITDRSTTGHDVANHFGAYRLAELIGKEGLIQTPKNLYFHYLLSRTVSPDKSKIKDLPKSFENLNVLVIDDQIENGWSTVLNEVFKKGIIPKREWSIEIEKEIQTGSFDLILLDFRLNDGPGLNGLDRLCQIKGKFEKDDSGNIMMVQEGLNPVIPVIMFTASNKAWNMDDLYEAGADGYYVKEHPDTASDSEFSIKNYENFIKTIEKSLNKGSLLKPYWQALDKIKKESIIEEKGLADGSISKFQERIEERITMFSGLLKKAFEQTTFDQGAFFYSDYELAFLTLWSVLNEIQEALFIKDHPSIEIHDRAGIKRTNHIFRNGEPPITYLPNHFRWSFRGVEFLKYKYTINKNPEDKEVNREGFYSIVGEERSIFFYDKNTKSYDFHSSERCHSHTYWDKLHLQVAFLLKVMSAPQNLFHKLNDSNSVRNSLYLTHGGNSGSTEFGKLYSNDRKQPLVWQRRTRDLFSIVYFLCTAEEWNPQK